MEKVTRVLLLGSGALKIGQAGEFDYSGSQAIKALKEEGVEVILLNPNIATIQTSWELADRVYFLPVDAHFVASILERERPDGILLGFGGQTALNCGLELARQGVLERYGVKVLGTSIHAIEDTEDRALFKARLAEIGVKTPRSEAATTVEAALRAGGQLGYPVMVRSGFSLGGQGSGTAHDPAELEALASRALALAPQILVEECLNGWKEIEYEVVRDGADNCITVCNMENLDPMGIHTGESIVVAPSQTLTNGEYHRLREISLAVIRHLGIVGECNIQFALHPKSDEYRVIEVNARLSRSSALASKATGYPLAFIAAKLALGHTLPELQNKITKVTQACFEPSLDYVVVKVPCWAFSKFRRATTRIGTEMKSVGEVMAIGRTFKEALQKAVRMLDLGIPGLVGHGYEFEEPEREIREPTDRRLFAIATALERGLPVERINQLSSIDPWFLHQIRELVEFGGRLRAQGSRLSAGELQRAKQLGFSDRQVALLTGLAEERVWQLRHEWGIVPVVKQIDSLAGEYPAQTNYLYLTFNGQEDDPEFNGARKALVLGSGPYRIGSSVEFDWCCVNAVQALSRQGFRTLMLNCNPETVSTDYDVCDSLYFDELSLEAVREIFLKERPEGVVVSVGGQTPNNLAPRLARVGVPLLGTSAESIDRAEDRHKFSQLLDSLGVDQPKWREVKDLEEAKRFARKVGYPVLVRPSYVLSGAAMSVAHGEGELESYLAKASRVSPEHPLVISKFILNAKEIEIDAVAQAGELLAWEITEHVENAGVHSGDATLVLPPQKVYLETLRRVKTIAERVARALEISGPFNIQFIAKDNDVKVIECNLRASRSFPFVSKVSQLDLIDLAVQAMLGRARPRQHDSLLTLSHVGVKFPQFSYSRLKGADPVLGVEMASTGEVACLGETVQEALLKAMLATGLRMPRKSVLASIGSERDKHALFESLERLHGLGFTIYATEGTARFLEGRGVPATRLYKVHEPERKPNLLDYLREGRIEFVVNIPTQQPGEQEATAGYLLRRSAVDFDIPLLTNVQLARLFVEALAQYKLSDLQAKDWSAYRPPQEANGIPQLPSAERETARA